MALVTRNLKPLPNTTRKGTNRNTHFKAQTRTLSFNQSHSLIIKQVDFLLTQQLQYIVLLVLYRHITCKSFIPTRAAIPNSWTACWVEARGGKSPKPKNNKYVTIEKSMPYRQISSWRHVIAKLGCLLYQY
jgi:hypothetical protein